jgi:DNA mismatch repair protein MutS
MDKVTPLMQQYFEIKQDYAEELVFFQVGDFYELFFEDAKKAAAYLGIALTARGKNKGEPIPLCGVPVHALDHYLCKLVKGGFKVVLCDQLEEAKPGVIVKRGVRQVLTPGTLTDSRLLDARSASYLFSFYPLKDAWGLLFSELLTGQIFLTTITAVSEKALESELTRFFPDEIVLPNMSSTREFQTLFKRLGYCTTVVHEDSDNDETADFVQWIADRFGQNVARQIDQSEAMKLALRYFYAYMSKNQRASLNQFSTIFFYSSDDFLILDSATTRNLELVKNAQDGSTKNTLFDLMDCAKTSMGSRMIKKWIQRPLVKRESIEQRQEIVLFFVKSVGLVNALDQLLVQIGDLERIVGRIALDRSTVADYCALISCLIVLPECGVLLAPFAQNFVLMRIIVEHMGDFAGLAALLKKALYDGTEEKWIIASGFDERLDHMRSLVIDSQRLILELERKEQQETGIGSLKIRYNNVQGYYIEITNVHKDAIPDRYRRVQTLVGRERFMTSELQELQYSIEQSSKNIVGYEQELFGQIKKQVANHIVGLRKAAHALAHLDALLSLARLSYNNVYKKPSLNENRNIIIKNGRHPVVEQSLVSAFIPNDTFLNDQQALWIITGPNMGGKSTYLRQVALICVMAHMGSFVPAESADIALLDRIFTRLGASDNVAEGKSTFLVEMEETATICTQATARSLVILDEVGRGTSTFDGLAIAQAVVEHIFNKIGARCLFATHYHELTYLNETFPEIVVYCAASKKTGGGILFLYKIIKGIADGSFGIEVAKLADLPKGVIDRATVLIDSFGQEAASVIPAISDGSGSNLQELKQLRDENKRLMEQKQLTDALMKRIKDVNFDLLSPKKAFDLLWELKDL